MKRVLLFIAACGFAIGTAHAQQCLHGPNESAEQAARKHDALTATRNINNIQANQRTGHYLRYEELDAAPFAFTMRASTSETVRSTSLIPGTDILPNWQLTLDVTEHGYWFMIKDKTDPCGFAYISNQQGVIFTAEPIR